MIENMKKVYLYIVGALTGIANGLFGSGGGIIAVPMLEKDDVQAKHAHATSIAIILPLSIISSIIYFSKGSVDFSQAIKFIPGGLLGVFVGARVLQKIPNHVLKKIFGIAMIVFGIRFLKG